MHSRWVTEILNWIGLPTLAAVAVVFLLRKLHREFPFFFSYIVGAAVVGLIRFGVYSIGSRRLYFYSYWISDSLLALLGWLAIYEVFGRRIFVHYYRTRFYLYLFPIAALIIVCATTSTMLLTQTNPDFSMSSRAFEYARAAMLMFFIALMIIMGREWKRYEFGVICGFSLYTVADLVVAAVWSQKKYTNSIVNSLGLISWDLACFIWLFCFWKPAQNKSDDETGQVDPTMVRQANQWQTALKTWLTRKKQSL